MKRTLLLSFVLMTACTSLDLQGYVPGIYTVTPVPSSAVQDILPFTSTPISVALDVNTSTRVCTSIPAGKLHVRVSPGISSAVHGYLGEGEIVVLSGESKDLDGSLWVRLSQPVDGWVNENYLCSEKD